MTDHIIKAAKDAGLTSGTNISGVQLVGSPSYPGLAHITVEEMGRFYAIAFAAGMERAAEICEAEQDRSEEARADARFKAALKDGDERNAVDRGTHWMAVHTTNAVLRNAAKAIRAHAQNIDMTAASCTKSEGN